MWIDCVGRLIRAAGLAAALVATTASGAEQGQYRSRVQVDPLGQTDQGRVLSVDELEQQINTIEDPYAKSSAGRHLARHYVEQKEYDKAVEYYRTALAAQGLSDVANREMLRELAQVYMLSENYSAAVSTLERALRIDLVPTPGDFLLLARAHYQMGDYVAVVAALDQIEERGITLDTLQTRQALALYYRAGAWTQSEKLLKRLLELEPGNPDSWHQLASVYLQQGKKRQALDQLSLAREKSVPFGESDLILLVDLKAVNGDPYGGAEVLRDALVAGEVEGSGAHYRKLFELWYQAREQEQASVALVKAARLSGDIELYLYLAQLQMQQEAWSDMYRTMQGACANQLQDRYVSKANLFLGISQLKLGDEEGARRSFINAMQIGGASQQAWQWLQYMEAEPATERESRRVVGLCYGSEGKQRQVAELAEGAGPEEGGADSEADSFQFRDLPAQRLFYSQHDEPLQELAPRVRSLAIRMGVTLVKTGGTADGPLQLISLASGEERVLQLALPARGSPRAGGKYRIRRSDPVRVAYLVKEGTGDELTAAWIEFALSLQEAGYELSGESRLVFPAGGNSGEGTLKVELQLGIKE
jgi:tetratricopeptide (TPR) repeat protein